MDSLAVAFTYTILWVVVWDQQEWDGIDGGVHNTREGAAPKHDQLVGHQSHRQHAAAVRQQSAHVNRPGPEPNDQALDEHGVDGGGGGAEGHTEAGKPNPVVVPFGCRRSF